MAEKTFINRSFLGAWILLERHELSCRCSYCTERIGHSQFGVQLPKDKSRNSWRFIFLVTKTARYYFRWTLPKTRQARRTNDPTIEHAAAGRTSR